MQPPLTLAFDQITKDDLPHVGGKGANLGEMARAGFPVPPGFCVTTEAFRRFMAGVPGRDALFRALDALPPDDLEAVRKVGEEARRSLASAPVPAEVAAALHDAIETLGPTHFCAVRSSATAEDLPHASFAGQHDTYLNVRGEADLIERVRACWASLFTDRAILYRAQNGFPHRDVELSVVVQRMVFPDVAGILFTADPVTGSRKILSIDASYGLGEALVSGLVSADLYKVDKQTCAIVLARVAEKAMAIRPAPGGGTIHEELHGEQRTARALSDADVRRLAELGARVEAHYGSPQDIEWAIAGGEVFLLQTRPITSLFPLPEHRAGDSALHVYFSLSHAQVMTDPIPPLGISIWRLLLPFGKQGKGYNPRLTSAGGRLYVDITPLLRLRPFRTLVPKLLRGADRLAAMAIAELVTERSHLFTQPGTDGRASPLTVARFVLPLLLKAQARLWIIPPEGATDEVSVRLDASLEKAREKLASAPPGAARLRAAEELLDGLFFEGVWPIPPYLIAGMVAKALAGFVAGDEGADDINAIARGLSGNVTTEMDLAVGDLADVARRSPELVRHVSAVEPKEALRTAREAPGGGAFMDAWEAFMSRYGMRGPSEIDISRPRYRDEPGSLLKAVIGNLQHDEPGAHRDHHKRLAAEGEAAADRLVASARRGLLGLPRAALMRRLVRVTRSLLPVREHPKYFLVRTIDLVRAAVLDAAEGLRSAGRIGAVGDIWYLSLPEAIEALERPEMDVRGRIEARKADYERYRAMSPPRVLTSEGEALTARHTGEGLPAGAIAGSGVSAGVVEGIARVVLSPYDQILHRGEILIAPFTDPGWTPLFINAAGLVMEVGGLMTHGSVVAREYGIPAVVCVPDATKRIKTGQRIRVDGDLGYVQVLEDAVAAAAPAAPMAPMTPA